jgi:hypothetical protein
MTLKPWREIAVPHEDVPKGTFQQAEFAADLSHSILNNPNIPIVCFLKSSIRSRQKSR